MRVDEAFEFKPLVASTTNAVKRTAYRYSNTFALSGVGPILLKFGLFPEVSLVIFGVGIVVGLILDQKSRQDFNLEYKRFLRLVEARENIVGIVSTIDETLKKGYFTAVTSTIGTLKKEIASIGSNLLFMINAVLKKEKKLPDDVSIDDVIALRDSIDRAVKNNRRALTEAAAIVLKAYAGLRYVQDRLAAQGTLAKLMSLHATSSMKDPTKYERSLEKILWKLQKDFSRQYYRGFIGTERYREVTATILATIQSKDPTPLLTK